MKKLVDFIPAFNARVDQDCRPATQASNVEINERGLVCSVDRAGSGMHLLRLTADGKKAAGLTP